MTKPTTDRASGQLNPLRGSQHLPDAAVPSLEDEAWAARAFRQDGLADRPPMTMVEIVERQALAYRAWASPVGEFLARQLERLAQLIRFTDAETPVEFEDRLDVLEADARRQDFENGFAEGLEAGRRESSPCRCRPH